jgi:hypothetical protein
VLTCTQFSDVVAAPALTTAPVSPIVMLINRAVVMPDIRRNVELKNRFTLPPDLWRGPPTAGPEPRSTLNKVKACRLKPISHLKPRTHLKW